MNVLGPYNQGNLATQIERKTVPKRKVPQKKRVTVRYGISAGEKMLYFFVVIALVVVATFIIARYAQISDYNYQILETKQEVKQITEQNGELHAKIDELSKPERIRSIAEQMGLTRLDDTVRVFKGGTASN
ncbi:cell division protein FtsL [Aneurinibacillus sp. BA2021]|nr:cell division protein FtsL [Aneurinibacillus sp. BA2021]